MTKKPETDEEMAAIRVGGTVTPLNAQIYLAPYDPSLAGAVRGRGGEDPRGAGRCGAGA